MPRAHARTARSARRHSRVLGVAQSCLAPIDAKVYRGHSLLPESREPVHDVVARASGARPAPDADGKTTEITRFEALLEDLDLAGREEKRKQRLRSYAGTPGPCRVRHHRRCPPHRA